MKRKLITVVGIILAVLVLMVGAFRAGIRHAINNSEFWILEVTKDEKYDYNVHVLVDGIWYEHGLWVG